MTTKMFPGTMLVAATWSADGIVLLTIFFAGMGLQFARLAVGVFRAVRAVKPPRRGMIQLNLPPAHGGLRAGETAPGRESLCHSCALAHVVQGYERGEELVTCGYVFPPREVLFAVRTCTDHKPKRARSDAEIAKEGAVTFPPFRGEAANFRAAAAARNACGGK
ncbi:MAG: hypothetical protein WA211_04365 [Candidatus Acidiferrales bacterium]